MVTVRAKFRCATEKRYSKTADAQRFYEFTAVYDDGTPENKRYAKYTPSGRLEITVDNPAVEFELGKDYYLDFTPVDEAQA